MDMIEEFVKAKDGKNTYKSWLKKVFSFKSRLTQMVILKVRGIMIKIS
ncbi:hypothetical protein MBGDF03_01192 [Thermoplasmatales archaeon SCGC AB-540-F20]|nr:hypothetical protein MBGDF03_01192 [Thermoplasmatales archaeon SCGC AB-540-F20]